MKSLADSRKNSVKSRMKKHNFVYGRHTRCDVIIDEIYLKIWAL